MAKGPLGQRKRYWILQSWWYLCVLWWLFKWLWRVCVWYISSWDSITMSTRRARGGGGGGHSDNRLFVNLDPKVARVQAMLPIFQNWLISRLEDDHLAVLLKRIKIYICFENEKTLDTALKNVKRRILTNWWFWSFSKSCDWITAGHLLTTIENFLIWAKSLWFKFIVAHAIFIGQRFVLWKSFTLQSSFWKIQN